MSGREVGGGVEVSERPLSQKHYARAVLEDGTGLGVVVDTRKDQPLSTEVRA